MPSPRPGASRQGLLWPRPQRMRAAKSDARLPAEARLAVPQQGPVVEVAARRLVRELGELGVEARRVEAGTPAELRLAVDAGLGLPREGYRLEVGARGATVRAADAAGVLHGVSTLCQWLRLAAEPREEGSPGLLLPGLAVEDWPDFAHRGVLLDVSRDRVPKLDFLYDLVERLSAWKVNQLQLYTEHTFAYRDHEHVWDGASPFTPEEVLALDIFCRERAVELVACQQSFGHLHRWLRLEPYRRLAECPEGIEHPWSRQPEPYGLCPTDPGSLAFLGELYDQLLPCYTSEQVNVGFDEPIDLARCRSAGEGTRAGPAKLYLDFLRGVHRLASERGRRVQLWGDFLAEHPELLPKLPREATVLEWGYEADHPFAQRCRPLAEAGLGFYVCPGTSSWNSLVGRASNALANLRSAALAGKEAGAAGYLVCDWGDNGHLQPPPVSDLGFLIGAGYAWNAAAAREEVAVATLLDLHAFRDRAEVMGGLMLALGNAYLTAGGRNRNGAAFFFLLLEADRPVGVSRAGGLTAQGLSEARHEVRDALAALGRARMAREDRLAIGHEVTWLGDGLELAFRLGISRLGLGPQSLLSDLQRGTRITLALRARRLANRHRALWMRRSRPGGLAASASRLERLAAQLGGED